MVIYYICCMATYLGAVKKSKISSTKQMEKSVSIIINELDKLDATGEFKGVYWGWVNFMQLEGEMRSALERIKRQNK